MPNDHQRFTGINLHGSDQHGTGTWKSLCGESNEDIINVFYHVTANTPEDWELGHARWLLGASLWYGEAIKCPTLDDYKVWLEHEYAGPPDEVHNGLRHDWRKAWGTWLYPGSEDFWLASQRMMTWADEKIDRYLKLPEIRDHSDHVVICCSTGTRPSLNETPFNGLMDEQRVRAVFERVIAADKAPVCWCLSQEFFFQHLQGNHSKLLSHLTATAQLTADLCNFMVPFREMGDIYGGSQLKQRNDVVKAIRKGAPTIPIAVHERALEEIPVDDFAGVDGDVISLLQTGFETPTGGQNRPEDQVMQGSHAYDGAAGFVQANGRRMESWQAAGRMERHTNAVGEHSIPYVYASQPWKPVRTLESARHRGQILLQHGGAFALSAGATL